MPNLNSWILTDVGKNVRKESLFLGHDDLGVADCTVSKTSLKGGLREGVDLVEVTNGNLTFSVLPTRGMGIWKGSYKGIPIGWQSPIRGPVHPMWVDEVDRGGLGWLKGFDECIVRCGLDSNGAPGEDVIIDNNGNAVSVDLTLHGKIANLPAHYLEVITDSKSGSVSIIGEVDESSLFLPGLRLRSRIKTTSGSNRLTIEDEIINLKATPSELELVYHCNFGQPFLEEGSKLLVPTKEAAPRDARAVEGILQIDEYMAPTPGYVEQVYFYDLAEDSDHRTLVSLKNSAGDKAIALRFSKSELPCFTQWKNTTAMTDGYVTGLEPGTNYPNLKRFERENDRIIRLDPGESYRCQLILEVCDNHEQVEALEAEIDNIQSKARPVIHSKPQAKFSPM